MTDRTLSAADAPAALNAFVRGIERRAAVFAELLCGDAIAGDAALAAAIRAFRNIASAAALPEWPWRFWGMLLATPQLRQPALGGTTGGPLATLSQMPHGPRAAVLLRLAGGLGEDDAARALGLATGTYRMALQRALSHRIEGTADADALRALGEAVQARIKSLPAPRLAQLARIREATVLGQPGALQPTAARAPTDIAPASRWRRPALYALAGLTLAALATTFFPRTAEIGPDGVPRIRRSALPAAEPPAATFDARTALLSHRDFDLLLDASEEARSRDRDFHAWLAAESAVHAAADDDFGVTASGADAGTTVSTPSIAPDDVTVEAR